MQVNDKMVEAAHAAYDDALFHTASKSKRMRAALTAALATVNAEPVPVRELEWTKAALDGKFGWLIVRYAQTPFGRYYVEKFAEANYRVSLNEQVLTSILPSSVDEAICAAQADFDRRIRSALVEGGEADDGEEACVVCDEPLEAGDPVYWSTNDDGHMHADCATSYVDEDGNDTDVPPKPFEFQPDNRAAPAPADERKMRLVGFEVTGGELSPRARAIYAHTSGEKE